MGGAGDRDLVPRVVLASRSPRRAEILELLGVEFEADPAGIDELAEGVPEEVVAANARAKALAVAERRPRELVLGADTDVVLEGRIFGQPADEGRAREFLAALSGKTHRVLSGLCLVGPDGVREGVCETHVTFVEVEPALLERYLAAGEWRGRAGAYAIQGLGSCFVTRVDGDFSNVVGLPVPLLVELAPEILS